MSLINQSILHQVMMNLEYFIMREWVILTNSEVNIIVNQEYIRCILKVSINQP